MPIVPVTQAQPVTPGGGFDYVTVDAARRRVYAAHGGGGGLLIADADTGNVLGIVKVGPMAGVAVDPATGHVFTGNGKSNSVSEVDPQTQTILRTVAVDGPVDAIAYDPSVARIYADEDDGTRIFVIDAKTFKQIATVSVPGHKPEYVQVDPQTHEVYQNIATDNPAVSQIAVVDPRSLTVVRSIPTPFLKSDHPLQYDAEDHALLVAGENGVLAAFDRSGTLLHRVSYAGRVDQCNWDPSRRWLACAGGGITLYAYDGASDPKLLAHLAVAPGLHTTAIDPKTGTIWAVWSDRATGSASIQGFTYKP
ncbi:MAG: YncE family protein [Candidatus Eremiobacteraeota bacterium]|nr:YncE family protein [Candidatus Eremiobacteraeota bacterium]